MLRVGPEPSASQSDKTYRGVNFPEEYSYTMYGIPTTILRSTNKGKGYNARLSSGHTTATSTGYRAGSLSGYVPATPTGYRAGDEVDQPKEDSNRSHTEIRVVKVTRKNRTLYKDQFTFKDYKGKI